LDWRDVLCVGERVIKDANTSNDFFNWSYSILESTFNCISGITNNHWAMSNTICVLYSNYFSILKQYLINICVEHESSSIDSTDSRKPFWNTTKTINRINKWRVTISTHGISIKLNFSNHLDGRKTQEFLVSVESNCMSNEINSVWFQTKFLKH